MEKTQNAGRLNTADILKGLLILGVLFVHLFMLNEVDNTGRSAPLIMQPLYMGLLCFFIISGYFYRPGRGFVENMKRRSMKLLVALVICSVVLPLALYAWLWILGQPSTLEDLRLSLIASFGLLNDFMPIDAYDPIKVCYSAYVHYFLWAMFWSFIVFYAVADRLLANKKLLIVSVIALLALQGVLAVWGIKLPFYTCLVPITVALMLAGAFLAQQRLLETLEDSSWKNRRFWGFLAATIVLLAVFIVLLPPGIKFNFMVFGDHGGLSVFPYYVESILVFIVFAYLALFISKIPVVSSIFRVSGRHSLGLALLHIFVVRVILAIFYKLPTDTVFPPLSTVQTLILGVLDVAIIVIACELFERSRKKSIEN